MLLQRLTTDQIVKCTASANIGQPGENLMPVPGAFLYFLSFKYGICKSKALHGCQSPLCHRIC